MSSLYLAWYSRMGRACPSARRTSRQTAAYQSARSVAPPARARLYASATTIFRRLTSASVQGVGSSFSSRWSFCQAAGLAAARARASSDGGGVALPMAGMAGGEKMGVAGLASQVDGEARVLGVASAASAARGASSPSEDDESSMDETSTRAARAAVSSGDGIGPRGDASGDDDASESEASPSDAGDAANAGTDTGVGTAARPAARTSGESLAAVEAVSYTHLTLPTILLV